MASKTLWAALGSLATLIDGVAAAPTLKNLGSAALVLGNDYNNDHLDQYALFQLKVKGASAFTAGSAMFVWFLSAADNVPTQYEDGSSSVTPARPPDLIFPVRAVSSQQYITVFGFLRPGHWKPLFQNNGGQALTNTDSENILSIAVVDDEAQ